MEKPKKGTDFKEMEEKWRKYWEEKEIYKFDPTSSKPIFSVDTPPPTVSADSLHAGHAMSYSQAEFVVRFYRMNGYNVFYPMGFDDNGLPTEVYVEKKYKVNKRKMSRPEFIKLCLNATKEGGKTYEKLWRDLGISCDWSLLYSTIDERCRRISQTSFLDLYKKGLVERKNEPVTWCTKCQTALAQAEIETKEQSSMLHYIDFTLENGDKLKIATSRPELIPACVGMFVNEEDPRYKNIVGKEVTVPITNHKVKIFADKDVKMEFGTGFMMVCTWGDSDDVRRWKEHKLDTRVVINDNGIMNEKSGPLAGLPIKEARKNAIEILKNEGKLVKTESINHMLGVHERCDTEIEFHLFPQWFINILDKKDAFIKRGNELNWYPAYYRSQYETWIEGLKWDWCISRQRYYGVPFPIWYCQKCKTPIIPDEKDLPIDPTVDKPKTEKCQKCGHNEFVPEADVMDTWMTSSSTPLINAKWRQKDSLENKIYPLTLRPQAFEIIRTWLFYTIIKSHFHTNSLPWRDAMISGWGLAADGTKMSKSKGNYVLADAMINKYSADALRYWASSAHLGSNLNFSEIEVAAGRKLCIKLQNAVKFLAMHLKEYKGNAPKQLSTIDKWIISALNDVIKNSTDYFKVYEFGKARAETDRFFWLDLCDNYLEIAKDRLYKPEVYGEDSKLSAQYTLSYILPNILKLYAPIIPFITEDLFQQTYPEKEVSIHTSAWPKYDEKLKDKESEEAGQIVCDIISRVRRYKTEKALALNTVVNDLVITADAKITNILKGVEPDIKSATRALKLSYGNDGELSCEKFDIKVKIVI